MFKFSIYILTILLLFGNIASAIDVDAGVSFETDNTEYYISNDFNCDNIIVYNDAFRINNGNISAINNITKIKISLENINTEQEISFVSNETINSLRITNGFADFIIKSDYEYHLKFQSGGAYHITMPVNNTITYTDVPVDAWYIASIYKEYTKHFNNLFESENSWDMLSSIFESYESVCGATLFWLIIILIPFTMTWIKTQSVIIPAILALITGSTLFVLLPVVAIGTIKILMVIGIAGLLYHIIKSR